MKKITVINQNKKIDLSAKEDTLLCDLLAENGLAVPASCGRRGTCRKCAVKLISGEFANETADENGMIRSCRAAVLTDAVIKADFENGTGLTDYAGEAESQKDVCGIAVDIGTTTVAAKLTNPDGTTASASCLNPQSVFGADVISRIDACRNGSLDEMTKLIRGCINDLCGRLSEDEADEMVVSGNAAMLHIFCEISPESMGVYPFTPQFTDVKKFSGAELGFNIKSVTVLPSVSAFVGGDITAGIYALGLHKTDKTVFLADLGTNGELVLSHKGRLYCTSTAAGPALEGACIECGTGGISGAIDRVYRTESGYSYTTVGGAEPVGICGAGLVDAVALAVTDGLIDESGYMEENLVLCDKVYISQKDIRQYQLAKSAIYSGIETLCDVVGIDKTDIDAFYIAGGLGYYINPESAFASGLLPRIDINKVIAAGNTSLQGALMCVGNPQAIEEMRRISESCQTVDLGGNPDFNDRFMNNMFFS